MPVGLCLPVYGVFKMKRVPVSARVTPTDYAALQQIASDTDRTISEVMCEAVSRYLGHRGAGAKTRSRIATLESRVDSLTLLIAGGAGGDRAAMAQQFASQLTPRQ